MYMKLSLVQGNPYICFGTRKQCHDEYTSMCKQYEVPFDSVTFGSGEYTCYSLPAGGWVIRNLYFCHHNAKKRKMVRRFDKLDEALRWLESISAA